MRVAVLSIMINPLAALQAEVTRFKITTPVLSDQNKLACASFNIDCASMGGVPGHAFVLVDKDGMIKWRKDYGGVMYVKVDEVDQEVSRALAGS